MEKTLVIKFHLELEVLCSEKYDSEWVAEQFLSSGRFGIDRVGQDPPVRILSASCGVINLDKRTDSY